jgi:hypothetical protein
LNLVPAFRDDKREITVKVDGMFEREFGSRDIDWGMASEKANPRITEVSMRAESRA